MALGAGSVTPLQMAAAYSVFANGGYRVNPWLITKVTDHKGRVISETTPPVTSEQPRAIEARNAFLMNSLLQEVTRSGTAARAQATLKRPDLYGKTGTTNDSVDAWFAGYQPTIAAVTWIGYDTPRNLGSRETGGGLSLPVWISFMERALKGVPVMEPTVPAGVVNVGGEWFYDEYARSAGVSSVGLEDQRSTSPTVTPQAPPPSEERSRILDLFRN
jgi:penicillin-binding protein 1A